jgi:predicted nucleotidyltransferase component of viral defense system
MIRSQEIKEKAREYGVPISTIERNYAQNWLLKYLYHPDIILKGGTGIKKAYHENYRFSDDLDFSLTYPFKDKELFNHIKEAVDKAKEEVGINFQISSKFPKTETGFKGKIYFNIIQNATGTPLSIKVDITNYDNEIILLPTGKKKVFHSYSDEPNAEIEVYSLEEIFAEKIRALIQRTRARDLYDTGMLYDLINKDKVLQILDEKFCFKGVILDMSSLTKRKEDFSNAWDASLKHQLKVIADFEMFFNKVIKIISEIKT